MSEDGAYNLGTNRMWD